MNMVKTVELNTLDTKHPRTSEKYKVVPTKVIAQRFADLGFNIDEAKSVRVRDAGRRGYQKHFVRMSHPTMLTSRHSDLKFQLLLTNSHDGSSSFKLQLGIFRLVCSNGLVVGTVFDSIVLRHVGTIIEQIEPAIETMVAQIQKLDSALDMMKSKTLTPAQIQEFYEQAVKFRWKDKTAADVTITARRQADEGNNLFVVYNRAQEALMRGSQVINAKGRFRQSRAIKSIDKEKTINEKLFDLAYSYAQAA